MCLCLLCHVSMSLVSCVYVSCVMCLCLLCHVSMSLVSCLLPFVSRQIAWKPEVEILKSQGSSKRAMAKAKANAILLWSYLDVLCDDYYGATSMEDDKNGATSMHVITMELLLCTLMSSMTTSLTF
jgi:hypothetical protein